MRGPGALLALAVLLAGCGGSSDADAPRVLPTASAPVSPTLSPSPSLPANGPALAKDAAEFVEFFYAEIDRAFSERDPSIVAAYSLPSCKTCKLYIDSIVEIRTKNQRSEGGAVDITFAVAPANSGDRARVDVGFDYDASVLYDPGGTVVERTPARTGVEEQVEVQRIAGAWKVATIKRIVKS